MALEIYVGNYPFNFTSDDLLNLFQDFEGIKLIRSKNTDKKCFAFLQCLNQEQVVDIVTTMHDIDVCGRNLIVRASDRDLQTLILESLRENDVLDKHPRNTHHSHSNVNKSFNDKKSFGPYSSDNVVQDFPVGVRFMNPRLSSSLFEKKCDSDDQQKSSSHLSNAQLQVKPPAQSACNYKNISCQTNLPRQSTEVLKCIDNSQNISQASYKHNAKEQEFHEEGKSIHNPQSLDSYNPSSQNIIDQTPGVNSRFINPRLQYPQKKIDYVNSKSNGSHLSSVPDHITPTQDASEHQDNLYHPNLPNKDTETAHTSSQQFSQASHKQDARQQNFYKGEVSNHGQNFKNHIPSSQNVNQTAAGSAQFMNSHLQSPHFEKKNDCVDHNSRLSSMPDPLTQKACDYLKNPSQPNLSNRGFGVPKNDSSRNVQRDMVAHGFPDGGASIQKYQNKKAYSPGKQNYGNHATGGYGYNAKDNNAHQNVRAFGPSGSFYTNSRSRTSSTSDQSCKSDNSKVDAYQYESLNKPISKDDLFYVSVANFPFNTTIEDLYYLFQDFDPYNIIMICNFPLYDRRPTEAIICFQTQDQATDAIMNFDNTIYFRRVLVVTDATDLSMVPALLSMGSNVS